MDSRYGRPVRNLPSNVEDPVGSTKPIADYYNGAYAASDYWSREDEATHALRNVLNTVSAVVRGTNLHLLDVGCGPGIFLSLAPGSGF